jgi:hypothetical protein
MTVKALLDINPQGNYPAMVRDFQRIAAKLRRLNMSFDDMIHDIFLCFLGQWQQQFIHTQLDEFYSCGRGPIKNLNISTLADQLVARAPSSPNKYVPQNPQEFKLETRYRTSPTEPAKDLKEKSKRDSQRPPRTQTPCQGCGKGYHIPDECWTLHPEKAPRRLRQTTSKAAADDQKTKLSSKELVLRDSKQSNQANLVIDSQSRTLEWFLDTAANVYTTCL